VQAESAATITAAARNAGAHIKVVLIPSAYDKKVLHENGARIAGLSSFANYVPFEANTRAGRSYLAAMARYAPELQPPDQELALVSYIFTDLFLRGLEVAGPCPTRTGFIDALRAVHDYDAGGLLPGKINLTTDFGQLSTCYAFLRVNAGGTGYDIVRNNTPGAVDHNQWCGDRLDG
jgi:hypothetical protein